MSEMHDMHNDAVAKSTGRSVSTKLASGEEVIDKGTFCDFVVASNVNRARALLECYLEGRTVSVPKGYFNKYPQLARVIQSKTYPFLGTKSRVIITRFSANPYAEFGYLSFDANLDDAVKTAHEGFSAMKSSRRRVTQWIEIGVLDERYVQYVIQRNQLRAIPGHIYAILDGLGHPVSGWDRLIDPEDTMQMFDDFLASARVFGEAPAGGKWVLRDLTRNCNAQECSLVASDPASPGAFSVKFSLFIAWGTYFIVGSK
mgnify:CR=1 FL=1